MLQSDWRQAALIRAGAINPRSGAATRHASSAPIRNLALAALWLVSPPPLWAQSLTVGELLAVCERGRANGGVGVDAAFCEWHALPCDCKLTQADAPARWCLPKTDSAIDRARERVIAELKRLDDPTSPAQAAVERVLARLYPCARE